MKKLLPLLLASLPLAAMAQTFYDSPERDDSARIMQYYVADGAICCDDGHNLYTRALYGGNSFWRLETSDRPIFAAYEKKDNRNITLRASGVRLDSASHCRAAYLGGMRSYRVTDPAFGAINVTALALYDREGAIWKVDAPAGTQLCAEMSTTVRVKINRSGDLGVDPANCFAPDSLLQTACITSQGKPVYFLYADKSISVDRQPELASAFARAMDQRDAMLSGLTVDTPDERINLMATSLLAAADGIWDGETYQHGAVGWRTPLAGWRGAYTGDFLGQHDRARKHFDAYANSQVTDVEPTIPHPTQDASKGLARSEKRWGTQMYSNGYLCRYPNRNDVMHHYDMNLCYIDELLWHLRWTGDLDYARRMWPMLQRHLQWEKRNFDPDDDGLYDAYCCIWASDALYYNSGGVTHSSAYNYRANKIAAEIAELIGEDPEPYRAEAKKILEAINQQLWMADQGVWAEFRDSMGHKRLHTHPALWTIYHAIDSDIATPEQAYAATMYIDRAIPHIPVEAEGLEPGLYTLSTTDWLPYAWSINNVAFAEVYHTALAYWLAGRADEAFALLLGAMADGMLLGDSPGNVGQISHYDAARGECYRDFADPVGVLSRALVQGLFGFNPDALHRRATVRPGFPQDWEHASIHHPDFDLAYRRQGECDVYDLTLRHDSIDIVEFILPVTGRDAVATVNGKPAPIRRMSTPVVKAPKSAPQVPDYGRTPIAGTQYEPIDLSNVFNATVIDIFTNDYLTPRSPYTTLQIPVHGIGEWCHPEETADIDDAFLRSCGGSFSLPSGLKFATPVKGQNVAFTSLFDNYPDSITMPLNSQGLGLVLLVAGSTNHMQCYMENVRVTVGYADGDQEVMPLVAPYNWCPIEQDYYVDGKAFRIDGPRPERVSLKHGNVSTDLGADMDVKGVYMRRIDGGAATVVYLPLNPDKTLKSLTLTCQSTDIVAGIMAATLIK